MTIPLFMLCKKVRVNSQPIQKALANLTVCGFGVYMIHYFFTGPSVVLARMCHVPVGLQILFAAVVAFPCIMGTGDFASPVDWKVCPLCGRVREFISKTPAER